MLALSFVIVTTGGRQSLLDELVLPAIFEQAPGPFEVVIAGRYAGRHVDRVRVVEAPTGAETFYKPFQRGVQAARHPWIVDLDDDMLLAADWGERIVAAGLGRPAIHGCRMRHPDGSEFGTYFDAVDNRFNGRRLPTSYFSCSVVPAEVYERVPYPTYQSGDRVHALRVADAFPELDLMLLDDVVVTHLGQAVGQPGLAPKTTLDQIARMRPLLAFLRDEAVSWSAFAERYLEGRPEATLEELWTAARAAVGDPDLARRHHWLV